MSNSLIVYSLQGCPYSMKTENTINNLKIDANIIRVTQKDKDNIKSKCNFKSFPQICLSNVNTIIGGSDEFHFTIDKLKSIMYSNESSDIKIDNIKNDISLKKNSNTENKLEYAYIILQKL